MFFDSKLRFSEHIANIINKANKMIGFVRRTFTNMDEMMFLNLYKSLTVLDLPWNMNTVYVIWSPYKTQGYFIFGKHTV